MIRACALVSAGAVGGCAVEHVSVADGGATPRLIRFTVTFEGFVPRGLSSGALYTTRQKVVVARWRSQVAAATDSTGFGYGFISTNFQSFVVRSLRIPTKFLAFCVCDPLAVVVAEDSFLVESRSQQFSRDSVFLGALQVARFLVSLLSLLSDASRPIALREVAGVQGGWQ